jgi:hypothetical protein
MARFALLLALALVVTGCKTRPAYNVENQIFASAATSLEERTRQIRSAGERVGWAMSDVGSGQMRGRYNIKGKSGVVVNIAFTEMTFSIHYDPATAKYDGENVRKQWNGYVRQLEREIEREPADVATAGQPK